MAEEANSKYEYNDFEKPKRIAPHVFPRLVMMASWGAGLMLAWTTVVSVDIRWRFLAMLMSALVLAPTLVLAFRQIASEVRITSARDRIQPDIRMEQASEPDDGKSGVYVDQPTGLASKRYFTMFLQREINRSGRARASLAVAVFDVDEFHKLEEKAGAEAVTVALADAGARIKSALREYDLVARYSIGRLAVVLPETDARGATEVVERLHQLANSVSINGEPLSITVGLAAFPDHGSNAEELVNSAHRALNRGKFASANAVHALRDLKKAS